MIGTFISNKYQSFEKTTGTAAGSYQNIGFAFGGDGAHNNMPPYRAVNIWRRIA